MSGEKPNKRFKSGDNASDAGGVENSKENNDDLMGQIMNEDGIKLLSKNDNTNDKKDNYSKRPVRKWEKRWVLQPNVIEYGRDIWISKWICVDNLNTICIGETSKANVQYYEKVNGLSSFPTIEDLQKETGD